MLFSVYREMDQCNLCRGCFGVDEVRGRWRRRRKCFMFLMMWLSIAVLD